MAILWLTAAAVDFDRAAALANIEAVRPSA
jgi:hypothetical protein